MYRKPSALYAFINKATTNIPSQYAIPIKGCDVSPNVYINLETEQEINRRNKKSSHSCSVKFALVTVFVFVLLVIVSMFIALFLQMRNLHEMNRASQKSVEKLNHDNNNIPEQTNLSHLFNLVFSMDNKLKQFNISFKSS